MVLPRFLTELKRRKVYRAALVYAGVGWVLLEAADVAFPRLGLPDWTVNFVLALVLFGFPLVIVFAWVFDFGAQGVVRTPPLSPGEHHHRFSITSIVEFVLICVLVATVGYLYVERLSLQKGMVELESAVQEKPGAGQPAVPSPEQYRAIAVLPFADMSEAADQAWFAEGIAEELLIALSQVEQLSVMARTSSFAFKDTDKTIAEIAGILGVQAVLEGSVRRSGDRVRITAQLVDATSGYHIWSGSYQRELTDIFQLQDELARAIVQALRVELGVDAAKRLIAEQTQSPEAYNWFMRGRALLDWDSPETLYLGISYFEKAVEADPNYAMAWGYLAYARGLSVLWQSFDEASPGAITAYEKALALDPGQSEALATKAFMTLLLQHDWETAGKLYQRAMASGENTNAMMLYSMFYLQHIDEREDAIHLHTEAEKRDPLHAGYKANLANIYIWSGNAEAAARKAREALALRPQHIFALMALIEAYTATENYSGIQQVLDSIPSELQQWPTIRIRAGLYYLTTGDYDKASEIYSEYIDNPPTAGVIAFARLALRLGEVEKAIDLMELEVERKGWTQFWAGSPFYFRHNDAIKNHPRYLALLKRIGLDDESVAALHRKMSFE
jgi:TolB-like protein/thioredoxin-like negative regulator of GroEL